MTLPLTSFPQAINCIVTASQILERIKAHPGSMMRVVIQAKVPTLAKWDSSPFGPAIVTKRSSVYVTAGTELANRKPVRDAIEAGLRGEVGPLPYGEWVVYPYIIGHTPKATQQYTEYIRLYPTTDAQLAHFNLAPKVEFFADDKPISREAAIELCGAKAQADDSRREVFNVSSTNIVSID